MVIELFTAEGSSLVEIYRYLRSVYGEDAVDVSLDGGSVVLRAVERTLKMGLAEADQQRQ